MKEAIDTVEQALREDKLYTVNEVARQCGISTTLAGECLRALVRGEICERQKIAIGKTKDGREKKVYHYKTKQKDLLIEGG